MIKLYFAPRTRSVRPRWLLEELGVPHELVRLDLSKGEHKQPDYLAIHPHGVVPALVDDDLKLMESVAICMYLADKYPEKGLAPAMGTPERGQYYQWLLYAAATIEPTIVRYSSCTLGPEQDRNPEGAKEAKAQFDTIAGVLARALSGREFLAGNKFSAADVITGSMLLWARSMKLLENHPDLDAYTKRLAERPAFRRAQG